MLNRLLGAGHNKSNSGDHIVP